MCKGCETTTGLSTLPEKTRTRQPPARQIAACPIVLIGTRRIYGIKTLPNKTGTNDSWLALQVLLRLYQDRFYRFHSSCHWFIFSMLFCCSLWMTGSTRSQSEVRQLLPCWYVFPALRARYTHFELWFVHTIASWCLWLIRVISLNNSSTSQLAVIWHASCWLLHVSTVLRTVNWQITVQICLKNSLNPNIKGGNTIHPEAKLRAFLSTNR